jgi:hypothetical protein
MADFHLWSKENLVKFAEDAAERLQQNEDTITRLRLQILRDEVKKELAEAVSRDTIVSCKPNHR